MGDHLSLSIKSHQRLYSDHGLYFSARIHGPPASRIKLGLLSARLLLEIGAPRRTLVLALPGRRFAGTKTAGEILEECEIKGNRRQDESLGCGGRRCSVHVRGLAVGRESHYHKHKLVWAGGAWCGGGVYSEILAQESGD